MNDFVSKTKMKIRRSLPGLIMVTFISLMLSADLASGQNTNAPVRLDYSAFKIIAERNIFNPNRRPRGSQSTRTSTRSQPASRVESFTLVGLMDFEKGTFAFFEGTSAGYKKTLQSSGEIAGYKLAIVSSRLVKLVEGTNVFELQVGQQMRREDDSDWFVADEDGGNSRRRITRSSSRGRIYEGLATGTNGVAGASSAAGDDNAAAEPEVIVVESDASATRTEGEAAPAAPAENAAPADSASDTTDPVLRRLIERRQQELNR